MSPSIPQKQCRKCHEYKSATPEFFPRNKNYDDGLHTHCKECQKRYMKDHPDIVKKSYDNFAANHPGYQANSQKEYRERHPEKIKEYKKQYAKDKPEAIKAIAKRGYIKHAEVRKAKQREYNRVNADVLNEKARPRHRQNYLKNPEYYAAKEAKRRALLAKAEGSHTGKELRDLYEEQECRCAYCGQSIYWTVKNDVHADHIQPLSRGGSNYITNIALACRGCNLSKRNKTLSEWELSRGW